MKSRLMLSFLCLIVMWGCNTVTTETNPPASSPEEEEEEGVPSGEVSTDLNHPAGNTAVVLGTDFVVGSLDLISLGEGREFSDNVTTAHSDGALFSFGGKLYVVNRLGADNIQVIDPAAGFATVLQCSVGQGTNPQEILVVSTDKGYVTLYQPDDNTSADLAVNDLLIVNPSASDCGAFITGAIDLTPYTAEDDTRLPRASSMAIVGKKLFVAIQDLPAGFASPDQHGKLVVVDTETDTVSGSVTLAGRNPVGLDYSAVTGLLYIPDADFVDLAGANGGIETVDPVSLESKGFLIDDADLGGTPGDLDVREGKGFVTAGSFDLVTGESLTRVVSFNLDPEEGGSITELYSSNAYIPDIALTPSGTLLIADWSPAVNGVAFVDPETGTADGGPVATGASPSSITFIDK